jgi:hypothetical protein
MKSNKPRCKVRVKCRGCNRGETIPAGRWLVYRISRDEPPCRRCGDWCRFVKSVK